MSLLLMDGFDLGDRLLRGYVIAGGALSPGRFGGQGLYVYNNAPLMASIPASQTVVAGFAFNCSGLDTNVRFSNDGGATYHVVVYLSATGTIRIDAGGVTGVATASGQYPAGWNYVEIKTTLDNTSGLVQVRVNGSPTNAVSFSGDTMIGSATPSWNLFWVGSVSNNSAIPMDDLYICNTLGTTNNDFLGECRIFTLAPNGNGTYSQLTGSDGNSIDNYLLVDEQVYSTADYVGSAVSGQKDSYLVTDLPATASTVYGVQQISVVAKSDAGPATIKQLMRIGTTDYVGAPITLSTTWNGQKNLMGTNPATSTLWTMADVNGIEIGAQVG